MRLHVNSETTTFASIFRFRSAEAGRQFAATRHVPWAPQSELTTKRGRREGGEKKEGKGRK